MRFLITGATGYVGGRLVPALLDAGHEVAVLVRDLARIARMPWSSRVTAIRGDLVDRASLPDRFERYDTAFYLVHSMNAGEGYDVLDRIAARNFARAGGDLPRVVYLGGLLPRPPSRLSLHLASRAEVGGTLAAAMPTLEIRCGPVIGAGSASFEVCRHLVERLPVMLTPRWIDTPVSTIGVRDMLEYLVGSAAIGATGVIEVGSEPATFRQIMVEVARLRGLHRRIWRLPVFAPRLAAAWVGLLTPVTREVAVPLVDAMVAPLRADTARARDLFPRIAPIDYAAAVAQALS